MSSKRDREILWEKNENSKWVRLRFVAKLPDAHIAETIIAVRGEKVNRNWQIIVADEFLLSSICSVLGEIVD